MTAIAFDAKEARSALALLPELAAQESLKPPELARMYVPSRHARALHLDASVVVGMRGAGKSWWTAVLASEKHLHFVSEQLPGSSLGRVTARVGFGLDETELDFPMAETLGSLIGRGIDPLDVWQAVVLRHALRVAGRHQPFPEGDWSGAVRWFTEHRDEANRLLTECDGELSQRDRVLLVLFDALDRVGGDWELVRRLTTGALRLGLRLRSRRAIRAKFFVRPDLDEDDQVWAFADSSKLRQAKVDLSWTTEDLYGLLLTCLGNAPVFGSELRNATKGELFGEWQEMDGVYVAPHGLGDNRIQRALVDSLADRTMGSAPKRGYTYSWVPLHLADAKGRISPRSYLLAFKRASEDTEERFPEHGRALHFRAVQQGVVHASQVRVEEICEDYPWVRPLLEAARGGTVPMTVQEVSSRWPSSCLEQMRSAVGAKLPPRRFTNDPFRGGDAEALIDDLIELAVLYRTADGRLNMPDIFRVGFGIRRKGGVKPPR